MAVINVPTSDTFENWRVKTNTIGTIIGDISTITTSATDLVSAVNEVKSSSATSASVLAITGDKTSLVTTNKTNLVAAINEVAASSGGDLATLTTTAKSTLVAAINEIDADVGAPASLSTTNKTNLVAAINEVNSNANTALTNTIPVTRGGTNATDAATARTNLGLGSMATQASNSVSITGGSVAASTISGTLATGNINATGSANQVAGINAANNGLEFKTITAGTNITVTHAANSITINSSTTGSTTATANTLAQRDSNADLYANSFVSMSDPKLKDNIAYLDKLESFNQILKLKPASYTFKIDQELTPRIHFGLIAPDVEEVIPELVITTTEDGLKAVDYQGLFAKLINTISVLNDKINEMQLRIDFLESELK